MLQVRKHFSSQLACQTGEMWFSCNGSPLRWHHPIGLLYDLLAGAATDCPDHLPWSITTHFSHFPVDQILPCQAREQVWWWLCDNSVNLWSQGESVFMSSLKEADQLKHSGKVVSMMQKKDHNQLWLGLISDKFDQFWAINRFGIQL